EISGRTNLSIVGANGINEALLPQITSQLGADMKASPVMETTAVMPSSGEVITVLGIDLVQDKAFRDLTLAGKRSSQRDRLLMLLDPRSILVSESLAAR